MERPAPNRSVRSLLSHVLTQDDREDFHRENGSGSQQERAGASAAPETEAGNVKEAPRPLFRERVGKSILAEMNLVVMGTLTLTLHTAGNTLSPNISSPSRKAASVKLPPTIARPQASLNIRTSRTRLFTRNPSNTTTSLTPLASGSPFRRWHFQAWVAPLRRQIEMAPDGSLAAAGSERLKTAHSALGHRGDR